VGEGVVLDSRRRVIAVERAGVDQSRPHSNVALEEVVPQRHTRRVLEVDAAAVGVGAGDGAGGVAAEEVVVDVGRRRVAPEGAAVAAREVAAEVVIIDLW